MFSWQIIQNSFNFLRCFAKFTQGNIRNNKNELAIFYLLKKCITLFGKFIIETSTKNRCVCIDSRFFQCI